MTFQKRDGNDEVTNLPLSEPPLLGLPYYPLPASVYFLLQTPVTATSVYLWVAHFLFLFFLTASQKVGSYAMTNNRYPLLKLARYQARF